MISQEELQILKNFASRIPQDDAGAHNNLAIVYYNKGLYDEAIDELEKALEVDPNFVLARNNLDIVLKKTGRLEEKVEQLARSIKSGQYDEKKSLELAETYRKLNRYSQSIVFYRKVIDSNPRSFEAHYGLGITLKLLGKYDDALEEMKKASEIRISPEVYRVFGEIYFNKGVIDLAIKSFEESIRLDPSSAEGHFLLGFALGEKGKTDESLESVKKAIELNPALAQFEPNLPIDIKKHKGHWEFLKEQLGVPKITESEYQVHYNLGMTYRHKGLFDEAKREFDECLRLQGDNPDLNTALGEVCIYLNRLDDAIRYLQYALDSDFDSIRCGNALGVAHCLKNELDEAVELFHKVLSMQEDFAPAFNNIGVCQFHRGSIEESHEWFRKAMERGNSDGRFNLGMYYLKRGNHENALKLFSDDTADDYFGKGLVYVELTQYDEAMDFFNKTLSIVPNHAGAHYNIGFILTKLGKYTQGLDYIRKGIESEANYEQEKFRLSLGPELAGFGPYYTVRLSKDAEVETKKQEVQGVEMQSVIQYFTNAENYLRQQEFESALNMVEQALTRAPDWTEAVILKAKILYDIGNTDDALNFLSRYVNKCPQDIEAKAEQGRMLYKIGRLTEAKDVYEELLKYQSDNIQWLTELGEILYGLHDLDRSLAMYHRIYEMDNEHREAHLGLLKISIEKKEYDKIGTYLDFFKEKHPEDYDFNVLAGVYHLEKNAREEALRYFQKAVELDSTKAFPLYHLGLLQVQKGDFRSACDSWEKALHLKVEEELEEKIRHCLRITMELSEFLNKEVRK